MYFYLHSDGVTPVRCDYYHWQLFHHAPGHFIAEARLLDTRVVTRFTGLDTCYLEGTPCFLFETLVIGGLMDGEEMRYESRLQALQGHRQMLRAVMEYIS